jgi:chloride channel 7
MRKPHKEFSPAVFAPQGLSTWESHDYAQIVNEFTREEIKSQERKPRSCIGYSGRTFTRWLLTWCVGISMGVIASIIAHISEALTSFRRDHIMLKLLGENNADMDAVIKSWLGYTAWNLGLTLIAAFLVIFVGNRAAVSGIPEVKATLNGIKIPDLLTFPTFFAKLVGITCVVSSGLILGPEGPLVHMGAIVGSAVTRGRKNIDFTLFGKRFQYKIKVPWMMQFRNDIDRTYSSTCDVLV